MWWSIFLHYLGLDIMINELLCTGTIPECEPKIRPVISQQYVSQRSRFIDPSKSNL